MLLYKDYHEYQLIHNSQRYADDVASIMRHIRKSVPVQMKEKVFNGKYYISIMNYLTEFRRMFDSSRIREEAAVGLFRDFMSGPTLAAIKVRLTLSSNDANGQKENMMSYAGVVNHRLRRYTTDAEITKAKK